jgi:hypothetical protein
MCEVFVSPSITESLLSYLSFRSACLSLGFNSVSSVDSSVSLVVTPAGYSVLVSQFLYDSFIPF